MIEADRRDLNSMIQRLANEVRGFRERVEDLEDAKELDAAIVRNGERPLVPWDQAKEELGLK
jgi:hypothetical protein